MIEAKKRTPPQTVNIAVTGHRSIPDSATLQSAIRQVLHNILDDHRRKEVCLYSALAEGGDQLVASIAQEFKSLNLYVPLPMAVEKYLENFSSIESRKNFQDLLASAVEIIPLSPSCIEPSAYEQLGQYLTQKGDILIALWNGVYNNKPGGTSEVVKGALKSKKPVYWLYSPNQAVGAINNLSEQKQIGEFEILEPNC